MVTKPDPIERYARAPVTYAVRNAPTNGLGSYFILSALARSVISPNCPGMKKPDKHETEAADARQGNQGRQVLYVLIIAVVFAVIAMTVVNIFGDNAPNTLGSDVSGKPALGL